MCVRVDQVTLVAFDVAGPGFMTEEVPLVQFGMDFKNQPLGVEALQFLGPLLDRGGPLLDPPFSELDFRDVLRWKLSGGVPDVGTEPGGSLFQPGNKVVEGIRE